jgi:hypothetical protein
MIIDVAKLDSQIRFLQVEAARVRKLNNTWGPSNAERFEAIAEVLRQLRQDHQMRGVTGERIDVK